MQLLPYKQETFVLPYPAEEALNRLRPHTRPVEEGFEFSTAEEKRFLFNGVVKKGIFRISRRVQKPENFLPLLLGRLETTSVGCLLFVSYRLFFSTAMYLVFWSVVCLLLTLFFLIYHQAWLYAAIAFGTGCVQYIIAIKNFSWQVNRSRQELEKVLFSKEG
ncbi:hypothetical protein [Cesiribacter sp. SM1]|uniref:hypothetical protein n=1 Tax=Cesiribacter sp. SM1 TaxID=2861196 RepID=UPI001CD3410C|nr:hypothetical protein [Cesiribacter sp. SM1]